MALALALHPGVPGDGDAAELTIALARFGAAHPTGYPLWTLAGGVFAHLLHALGVAWDRASAAWSALGAGAAVALLHALAARLLAREGASARAAERGALVPALAFAAHPLWLAAATQAEVHTWHVAWVLLACAAAVALAPPAAARGAATGARMREAVAWGALCGAGLAHHATAALVAAPLTLALVFAAWRARRGTPATLLLGVAAAVAVVAAADTFVAYRAFHPAPGQWESLAPSWRGVLDHLTGARYRMYTGAFAPSPEEAAHLARDVWPYLALLLPAVAWWTIGSRAVAPAARFGVAAAVAATLVFVAHYSVLDPGAYFLPALAVGCAVLPAAVFTLPGARAAAGALAWAGAISALGAGVMGVRAQLDDGRAQRGEEALYRRLWDEVPAAPGFLLFNDDRIARLRERQLLLGEKPRVELLYPDELTQPRSHDRFVARHGFEPVDRAEVEAAVAEVHPADLRQMGALVAGVFAMRLDARTPLPVRLFVPDRGEVRLMDKARPGAGSASGARGPDSAR